MAQENMTELTRAQPCASIDYQSLVFLAAGGSGVVYAIDNERILKEFHGDGINIEHRVLERLGPHANVVKCFGSAENGLIFERGRSLRKILQEAGADAIPLHMKIRWLEEAANGTQHMHDNGIIHADIGCHNWIIVQEHLKIIDFEGCSIDGEEAGACYEWFSYKESAPTISRKTDIFAFGCAMYEIITGRHPHDELQEASDRMSRVKELYSQDQFPEVENIPLGNIMKACWHGTFNSMNEVLEQLQAASSPATKTTNSGSRGATAVFLDLLRSWGIFGRLKKRVKR